MEYEFYKQKLLATQAQLQEVAEASAGDAAIVELDQSKVGRLSRMDAMQTQQMAKETARRRELELQKIAGALRRIDNDEFGECFVCNEMIEEGRLRADPTCTRCIKCAE